MECWLIFYFLQNLCRIFIIPSWNVWVLKVEFTKESFGQRFLWVKVFILDYLGCYNKNTMNGFSNLWAQGCLYESLVYLLMSAGSVVMSPLSFLAFVIWVLVCLSKGLSGSPIFSNKQLWGLLTFSIVLLFSTLSISTLLFIIYFLLVWFNLLFFFLVS